MITRISLKSPSRVYKAILLVLLIALPSFGLALASAVTKKREFQGRAEFLFCTQGQNGKWVVFDKWTPNLSFKFKVSELLAGAELSSNFTLNGRTQKGWPINLRLARPARGNSDRSTGQMALELPFDITVDGRAINAEFNATTETTQGAEGIISGRRASFDTAERSFKVSLVASKEVRIPAEVAAAVEAHTQNQAAVDSQILSVRTQREIKKAKPKNPAQTILVVGRIDGQVTDIVP